MVIACDNGSVLNDNDFKLFAKSKAIKHTKSASYHASTNGCTEKGVRRFKVTMKKLADIKSMAENLQMFFSVWNNSTICYVKSPKELMNRKLNNMLNIIKLDADSHKASYPRNSQNF